MCSASRNRLVAGGNGPAAASSSRNSVFAFDSEKIFAGPNDLVVDTPSMVNFQDGFQLPRSQTLDFGTTDRVHHTNYFEQRRTISALTKWLQLS